MKDYLLILNSISNVRIFYAWNFYIPYILVKFVLVLRGWNKALLRIFRKVVVLGKQLSGRLLTI